MKILIINWRSVRDPLEGGAERATIEHAKRWVKEHGAQVTWLCPRYDKNIDSETIEGVQFHYIGLPLKRNISEVIFTFPLFYFLVFWTYLTKFKGKIDVVIDQVHGIPYLTPLYVREKIVVYIHEVAGEIWDIMYPFPVNKIGRLLEKIIYPPYKNIDFVGGDTVSKELPSIGIPFTHIHTIKYGVTAPKLKKVPPKNQDLTIVFLNRLVKMKGPERAIEVFELVHRLDPKAKMIISGKGEVPYENFLRESVHRLGLESSVKFIYATDQEKFKLLAKAHVLLNTSFKEGWGLVNIEANCMGTPAISFDVPGNRESIVNGVSGFVFPEKDIQKMAKKIVELKNSFELQKSSLVYSRQFDWDKVSNEFYEVLNK